MSTQRQRSRTRNRARPTSHIYESPSLAKGKQSWQSRPRKRLIVACDGTWQDSTSSTGEYPSNVTRIVRAISKIGYDEEGGEIEQIVYYQKGVGTGVTDGIYGGALGYGVSANVRAAYGFLAHNYAEGDDIFFFGFSRGAYTARAIASLVAETGLLTKLGMDRFSELYNTYYDNNHSKGGRSETPEAKRRAKEYIRTLSRDQISHRAGYAIRIVGIWDTVAFHKPILSNVFLFKLLGFQFNQERIEFNDTLIPHRIEYGFHALSLDETRKAYQPTMWTLPTRQDSSKRQPILKQVWFSGAHSDVGGGREDHRLSDIALACRYAPEILSAANRARMISECSQTGLLSFDENYLLKFRDKEDFDPSRAPWATQGGKTKVKGGIKSLIMGRVEKVIGSAPRQPLRDSNPTNEAVHASIIDRRFGTNEGAPHAVEYESNCIAGWRKGGWEVRQDHGARKRKLLYESDVGRVEMELKGKIRSAKD